MFTIVFEPQVHIWMSWNGAKGDDIVVNNEIALYFSPLSHFLAGKKSLQSHKKSRFPINVWTYFLCRFHVIFGYFTQNKGEIAIFMRKKLFYCTKLCINKFIDSVLQLHMLLRYLSTLQSHLIAPKALMYQLQTVKMSTTMSCQCLLSQSWVTFDVNPIGGIFCWFKFISFYVHANIDVTAMYDYQHEAFDLRDKKLELWMFLKENKW